MTPYATIRFGKHGIQLTDVGWVPTDDSVKLQARIANVYSKSPLYEYRPWQGGYGTYLAEIIVKKIGGRLELQESDPDGKEPVGIVF